VAVDHASTTTALPAKLDSSEVLAETDVSDSLTRLAAGCMSPLLEGRGSFRPCVNVEQISLRLDAAVGLILFANVAGGALVGGLERTTVC
jgi:hypothetical protein